MNKKIIDTNILLDFPSIVEKFKVVIPTIVLRELDGLKRNINSETAQQARRAAIYISNNMDNIEFWTKETSAPVDDQLIEFAKEDNDILITNDVYLKVRAIAQEVITEGFSDKDDYDGYYIWNIDNDEDYQNAIDGIKPEWMELFENEYVIAYLNKEFIGVMKYKGNELIQVVDKSINREFADYITPRNPEQTCLIDALYDRNNTIIVAQGRMGSGKSYITNNFALRELEKGKIDKIVYVPNNSYVNNTIDQGALPGDLNQKVLGQLGPLLDLVGEIKAEDMQDMGQLEIVPMGYMRGRSFDNSIIIVNEAQNLTEEHIKLLIARCGEGSRIIFDGDYKQVDSALFKNKNGLKSLMKLRKSPVYSKLFSVVTLTQTERSITAAAAEYLDNNF